jgi:hypothetical protein
MRNDRKVPKQLFSPAFSFLAILVITAIFSMIESIESTNRAFLKVFVFSPMIKNAISLAHVDFFHLQTQRSDYLFCLINGLMDCVVLGYHVLKEHQQGLETTITLSVIRLQLEKLYHHK